MNRISKIRHGSLFTVVVLSTWLTAPSSAVQACNQWTLVGPFSIEQENGVVVTGSFQQQQERLSGSGQYYSRALKAGSDVLVHGGVEDGVVSGDRINFRMNWWASWVGTCALIASCGEDWKSTGVYEGTIRQDGRVAGIGWDQRRPGNKVNWYLRQPARCAAAAPTGKTRRAIGKAPSRPSESSGSTEDSPHLPQTTLARPPNILLTACKTGFVWREAAPADKVCVPLSSRNRVAEENRTMRLRVDPQGPYGRSSCKSGFVWREAFSGDTVCVVPSARDLVKHENRQGPSRRVGG